MNELLKVAEKLEERALFYAKERAKSKTPLLREFYLGKNAALTEAAKMIRDLVQPPKA